MDAEEAEKRGSDCFDFADCDAQYGVQTDTACFRLLDTFLRLYKYLQWVIVLLRNISCAVFWLRGRLDRSSKW